MLIQSTFIILLAISVILSMSLAFFAWLRREVAGAIPFMFMMFGSILWGISCIIEVISSTLETKLFWDSITFFGLDLVTVGMFLFILVYTGRADKYKRFLWVIFLEPILSVVLLRIDNWLGWMRLDAHLDSWGQFIVLDYDFGFALFGMMAYTYLLIFASLILLVMQFFRQHRMYRRQLIIMILGVSVLLGGAIITEMGWVPISSMQHLDITPITLSVTNILWTIGLFYFGILDFMPVIRQIAFDEMKDSIFILDIDWRIADLNQTAKELVNEFTGIVIGQPLTNYLAELLPYLNDESAEEELNEFTIANTVRRKIFSVKLTPIYDQRAILGGWVLVLMDITKLKNAEEQIRLSQEISETLREVGSLLSSTLDFEQLLARMLELIERLIPYDSANIMLIENEKAFTKRTRGYEKYGANAPKAAAELSLDIEKTKNLKWMVDHKKPLVINDVQSDPDWVNDLVGSTFRSWLGAPIISQGKVSAFFSLGMLEPGYYSPIHAEHLVTFAAQAALAMENANLYTEIRSDLNREQRLNQSMRVISRMMEVDAIFQDVIELCLELFHAERAELGLIFSNGGFTCHDYRVSARGQLEKWEKYEDRESTLSWALIETIEPVLLNVLDEHPLFPLNLASYGVTSMISLPLMAGNRRLGILCLFTEQDKRHFTRRDLALAESIGHQAGNAVQNARLFKDVQRLAITDPLTGWFNRRHFFERAQNEMERSKRYRHSLSVIMLDIDWFKKVNDTYGHLVGDQVLQGIAKRIEKNLRHPDFSGRYGGEEFVILLPETGLTAAQQAAERIRLTVSNKPIETTKGPIQVSISLGVACAPASFELEIEKILDMADQALYAAKNAGRNRVAVWRDSGIHEVLPLTMNHF